MRPTPDQFARIKVKIALHAALRGKDPAYKELFDVGLEVAGITPTTETEAALLKLFVYAVNIGKCFGNERPG